MRNSIVNPFEDPVNGYSEICGYMFQEDPDSKPGVLSMILPGGKALTNVLTSLTLGHDETASHVRVILRN